MIARIEIKGDWVIKGIRGDGLRKVVHISEFNWEALALFSKEIFIHDVTATLFNSQIDFSKFLKVRSEVYRPMIYGGGVSTIHDIGAALSSGFDRVYICSGSFKGNLTETFLEQAVSTFGSSTIVVGCELVNWNGVALANVKPSYTRGRFVADETFPQWIHRLRRLGDFEVCVLDFDKEGTGIGLNFQGHEILSDKQLGPIVWGGGGSFSEIEDLDQIRMPEAIRACVFSRGPLEKLGLIE